MRLALLEDDDLPVTFGRYTLSSVLGEGGMARVFRAELRGEQGFRKAVALKIVRVKGDEGLRRALIREARLGGLLHHPNIVETYDFGSEGEQFFVAMELVDGIGLDGLLAARGWLPVAAALDVADGIAAALDHAWSARDGDTPMRLVHRDLKPANVLLTADGRVKVADFGIAKVATLAGDTATGTTKGTPSYMSPEQLGGAELDQRSDLFALGAILWELVLGNQLHEAATLPELVLKVITIDERLAEPANLAPLDAQLPGLAAVVAGCLRKDPAHRWPDARSLRAELRRLRAQATGAGIADVVADSLDAPRQDPAPPQVGEPLDPRPAPPPAPLPDRTPAVTPTRAAPVPPPRGSRSLLPALLGIAALLLVAVVALLAWPEGTTPGSTPLEAVAAPEAVVVAPPRTSPAPVERASPAPDRADDAVDPEPADALEPAPEPATAPPPVATAAPTLEATPAPPASAPTTEVTPSARPAVPAAPATTAPPAPRVLDADWEKLGKRKGRLVIRFTAEATCGAGCTATLDYRATGREWESTPMEPAGRGRFAAEVRFPQSAIGHVRWAVIVRDDSGRAAKGSRDRPMDFFLR